MVGKLDSWVNIRFGHVSGKNKPIKAHNSYLSNINRPVSSFSTCQNLIVRDAEQRGLKDVKALPSGALYPSCSYSLTCNVTVFCHLLETALDKVWASQSVLPWQLGSQLCIVGHIQAFMEDRERGRNKMCPQKR